MKSFSPNCHVKFPKGIITETTVLVKFAEFLENVSSQVYWNLHSVPHDRSRKGSRFWKHAELFIELKVFEVAGGH